MSLIDAAEAGNIPDGLLRLGIRGLLVERILTLQDITRAGAARRRDEYIEMLKRAPILVCAEEANQQHYEVPSEFFSLVLGPHLKYSSCLFQDGDDLGRAEERMLELSVRRAGVVDGMSVLDLGCGWGSMTRYLLGKFPSSNVTAISNSASQREFILKSVSERDRSRLRIITGNIAELELSDSFDRIISIEMFEHCRNYGLLLNKLSRWLNRDGELFVHIFTHRSKSYLFEVEGASNWMGKYFFTGGQMPAHDLLYQFQADLKIAESWRISGRHYQQTAEEWLRNLDHSRSRIMPVLDSTYGRDAEIWLNRWRLFFLAVSELFGFWNGTVWGVSHYRFTKR